MDSNSKWSQLAGRVGLGAIFLLSGAGKLANWSGTVGYAGSKGVPQLLLAGATALEVLGAVSLLSGFKTRWGAAALLAFLLPVTFVFHGFWAFTGAEQQQQMIHFLKNFSIGGGLLFVLGTAPGALSVDAHRARAAAGGIRPAV